MLSTAARGEGHTAAPRLELRATTSPPRYRRLSAADGWDDAIRGFEACLALDPEDPPSLRLSRHAVMQFREYAPAHDWDGVWALEVK